MSQELYNFKIKKSDGQEIKMEEFKGQTLLIVNTASKCGFTKQYDGLESLYEKYKDRGFQVLAFPCDQFGNQEPGSDEEIASFCSMNFNIQFPVFKKIEVNGDGALPLFNYLKDQAPGLLGSKGIKWNFTKFLISKDGTVVKRYAPKDEPKKFESDIKKLLEI